MFALPGAGAGQTPGDGDVAGDAAGDDEPVVDAATEAAIEGALRWLAARQTASGSWQQNGQTYEPAITAYVLLAFVTSGNLPGEGPYGEAVAKGLDFLLESAQPDGYIASAGNNGDNMYGHGIATLVLGEIYGQTQDERLRPRLERAVQLIVGCQNDEGGWRYQPRKADADISVTVLQVAALRVAQNSGIAVPQSTIDRAVKYIRSCQHPDTGGFNYQPRRSDPGFARTAAAIYSLQMCGLYDDAMVERGADYLERTFGQREWFTYGNHYAGPAMMMMGGARWKAWYTRVRDRLLPLARRDGDLVWWRPLDEGNNGQGEVYATAVYATILALPYNYVPIYQR